MVWRIMVGIFSVVAPFCTASNSQSKYAKLSNAGFMDKTCSTNEIMRLSRRSNGLEQKIWPIVADVYHLHSPQLLVVANKNRRLTLPNVRLVMLEEFH